MGIAMRVTKGNERCRFVRVYLKCFPFSFSQINTFPEKQKFARFKHSSRCISKLYSIVQIQLHLHPLYICAPYLFSHSHQHSYRNIYIHIFLQFEYWKKYWFLYCSSSFLSQNVKNPGFIRIFIFIITLVAQKKKEMIVPLFICDRWCALWHGQTVPVRPIFRIVKLCYRI